MPTKITKILLFRKRKFITIGVLVFLFLIFSRKSVVKVETTVVARGDIIDAVSASGNCKT